MATPKQQFDGVKDVLRGMGLHGLCDRIDHAVVALNANYGHVLSAYAIENERLKARIRELEGGEK